MVALLGAMAREKHDAKIDHRLLGGRARRGAAGELQFRGQINRRPMPAEPRPARDCHVRKAPVFDTPDDALGEFDRASALHIPPVHERNKAACFPAISPVCNEAPTAASGFSISPSANSMLATGRALMTAAELLISPTTKPIGLSPFLWLPNFPPPPDSPSASTVTEGLCDPAGVESTRFASPWIVSPWLFDRGGRIVMHDKREALTKNPESVSSIWGGAEGYRTSATSSITGGESDG